MSLKIAVCILNYNGRKLLQQFLPTVVEHTPASLAEIYVIDNASTDDSLAYVKAEFPTVKIVENTENHGFTGGYNIGLQQINATYYLLINSDIEVTSNYLEPLVKILDENPNAGACQPKIKAFHQKDSFEYAGAAGGYVDWLGYPFCRGRIFETLEKDEGQYDNLQQVFWASGACMLIKSTLYHEVGGFDISFFAHMEEIDLCWRVQRLGYEIYCEPQSIVYHVGGGTLNKTNPRKTYLNFRNSASMLHKNVVDNTVYWKFAIKMVLDLVAALKFGLENSPEHTLAVLKAYKDFFRDIKNKRATKRLTKTTEEVVVKSIYKKMIVWQYYVRRRKTYNRLKKI